MPSAAVRGGLTPGLPVSLKGPAASLATGERGSGLDPCHPAEITRLVDPSQVRSADWARVTSGH